MTDIYEKLQDVEFDPETMEKEQLSQKEKVRIFQYVMRQSDTGQKKRRKWKPYAAAAVVGIICLGIGIPVVGSVLSYLNGNTRKHYREEILEIIPAKEVSANEQSENKLSETTNSELEILEVSREDREMTIRLRFTFDRDISGLEEACEAFDEPQKNVLEAEPFSDCTVYVDEWDMKVYQYQPEGETEEIHNPFMMECRNTRIEGNILEQRIRIQLEDNDQDHTIRLHYRNIRLPDGMIEGEWEYEYIAEADAYKEELATMPIDVSVTDQLGNVHTMDSFAVTPNGLVVYGTSPGPTFEKWGNADVYVNIWIQAEDNLGNLYLLARRSTNYKENVERADMIYELYDGPALEYMPSDYQTEWNLEADSLSFALMQEADQNGDTEYTLLSDPFEITLTNE